MPIRYLHLLRVALFAVIAGAALMVPRSDAVGAPAMAVYRGEVPAAGVTGRKIEMRLKADGTMSLITDYRNNRAPITEDGRWNPLSLEEIDVTIERRDGVAIAPLETLHFIKQGDILQTRPESSAQFGSQGLQLRQVKAAAAPAAAGPVRGASNTTGSWRWEGMVSSADKISIEQPERYTLELQGGGKALVRADCNRGQATYKFDGRAVAIKILGMTKGACPPGSMSERYTKSLEAAVGQRIRGDNLFLDLPGEGGTMKFVRAK